MIKFRVDYTTEAERCKALSMIPIVKCWKMSKPYKTKEGWRIYIALKPL